MSMDEVDRLVSNAMDRDEGMTPRRVIERQILRGTPCE